MKDAAGQPGGRLQHRIAAELDVTTEFDPPAEIERRIAFLADYLRSTGRKGYVLGISGGVDSLLAGHLAQKAVERVRRNGGDAIFHAMRLPYGVQQDEQEAQKALVSIGPDRTLKVDIKPACDALLSALREEPVDGAVGRIGNIVHVGAVVR